jgi:hypothetical protein
MACFPTIRLVAEEISFGTERGVVAVENVFYVPGGNRSMVAGDFAGKGARDGRAIRM